MFFTSGRYGCPLLISGTFQPSGPTSHHNGLIFVCQGIGARSVICTVSIMRRARQLSKRARLLFLPRRQLLVGLLRRRRDELAGHLARTGGLVGVCVRPALLCLGDDRHRLFPRVALEKRLRRRERLIAVGINHIVAAGLRVVLAAILLVDPNRSIPILTGLDQARACSALWRRTVRSDRFDFERPDRLVGFVAGHLALSTGVHGSTFPR